MSVRRKLEGKLEDLSTMLMQALGMAVAAKLEAPNS
jgi:hypothetical protein